MKRVKIPLYKNQVEYSLPSSSQSCIDIHVSLINSKVNTLQSEVWTHTYMKLYHEK